MSVADTKATFLRIPWAAHLLSRPNTVCRVPGSRTVKSSTEDSLFAEGLKTSRTITSCLSFYAKLDNDDDKIEEVSTLMQMSDAMNGHPYYLHGGIIATVIDEAMGILQNANNDRQHLQKVAQGLASGESPAHGVNSFTASLTVNFLKPVHTPGSLVVTARYTRREGRKEWIHAEVKQHISHGEDDYGEEVVCATGDALFIEPRASKL
ncbi:hypothetical protein LTR62_007428 [Meristemomyces frigidus]|uniref:Thioesterase domain-containing protein n=1 Tax=Meristemomyces frigidus TaxID=1508187 RepID=A0AAN7TNJ8_9PEZI|nr:hypothetical protein LTR62_007428 [Meristemomyces frigidus]